MAKLTIRASSPNLAALKAPVAQLDRASDYGSEGLKFESSRARFFSNRRQPLKIRFAIQAITGKTTAVQTHCQYFPKNDSAVSGQTTLTLIVLSKVCTV